MESLTECDSPIISSRSVSILETLKLFSKVGTSPIAIVNEFSKVLKPVADRYREIVSSLSCSIGDLTVHVTEAITNLECALNELILDFQNSDPDVQCDKDEFDYEPVLKNLQILTNTVAAISETALSGCDIDDDVRDSVYVLALILDHFIIMCHGTTVSIAATLHSSTVDISVTVSTCLQTIDPLVCGIADALSATTNSLTESITLLLTSLVSLNLALNAVLKEVIGVCQSVTVTVAQITQCLTKTVSSSVTGITSSLRNIFNGVRRSSVH